MQVNSSSNQQNVVTPGADGQNGTSNAQPAQPPAQPAIHDTSAPAGTQTSEPEIPGLVVGKKPPPGENVGTVYKFDDNGKPQYYGYYPASNPHPTNKGTDTPATVFWRGFGDGATHPGQTMGKIDDMRTGDKSKKAEEVGKQVDNTLQKLPVVGDAMTITQGMAGETNPDGTPKLPDVPSVQPDEAVKVGKGSPKGKAEETALPSDKAPAPENGKKPVQATTENTGAEGSKNPSGPSDKSPATGAKADTLPSNTPRSGETPAASPPAEQAKLDIPKEYAYSSEPKGNLEADPQNRGVYKDEKGQSYIQANNQDIPVQYDKDNGTWRAYQPSDPAKPQYPVQLDANGNWKVHDNVGLKGGAPGGGEASGSGMTNRDRLGETASNSPTGNTPGAYPSSVNVVNSMLKHLGVDLSNQSAEKIVGNIERVDAGTLSHAGASASEAWTFARDVADPSLPMKDRAAAALGMTLNGLVSPAYHAEFDLQNYHFGQNQSADLRRAMQMYVQFDPHA